MLSPKLRNAFKMLFPSKDSQCIFFEKGQVFLYSIFVSFSYNFLHMVQKNSQFLAQHFLTEIMRSVLFASWDKKQS